MRRRRVQWRRAWRIIASRFPPIDLFERVSGDPAVWEALIAAEQATNPRLRDAAGEIALVPPEDRVAGLGASYVMAPFTHVNPAGSRFSDGRFGVCYLAREFATALRETAFHFARLAGDAADPPRREDMRVLTAAIDARLHDVDSLPAAVRRRVLDPESYDASRALGARLRADGSPGVVYPSLRNPGGMAVGAFTPRVVRLPVTQERHLQYAWDGRRVARYFDYAAEAWFRL